MKTKEEILGKIDPMTLANSPHREGISVKHAKQAMDEYAEETLREYCSWAHWCATGVRPDPETVQQTISRFKESLKK